MGLMCKYGAKYRAGWVIYLAPLASILNFYHNNDDKKYQAYLSTKLVGVDIM